MAFGSVFNYNSTSEIIKPNAFFTSSNHQIEIGANEAIHEQSYHIETTATNEPTTNFWDRITDKRVNEFYLLSGGPSIILSIIGFYIYFVVSIGPKLMAKQEPFKLNKLLLVYNGALASANLWLFHQGLIVSNYGRDTWGCGQNGGDTSHSPTRGIYLGYLFFLTKLIELLDTVFFVLRKKANQITFLHVFHHSLVPFFCWLGIKLAPGGSNGFFPLINSFIHVIMYIYYALSTLGPRVHAYLWWKKHLTSLQMVQFVLVMINAAYTFSQKDCKFPIMFLYLQASVAFIFLALFSMFYRNAYIQNKHRSIQQAKLSVEEKNKKKNSINMISSMENENHQQGNTVSNGKSSSRHNFQHSNSLRKIYSNTKLP